MTISSDSNKYDVAIVGAGISGLIAANYLIQSGFRVFIAEQHYAVGGCCSFFKRGSYIFECGAHSLGSCRNPDGYLYKVFNELGIYDHLPLARAECSDSVISDKYQINFSTNADQMIAALTHQFYNEKDNIRLFFEEIERFGSKTFLNYYSRYKNITFKDFLNKYFDNDDIKKILSVFLGNIGVPSDRVSTITALALYREFVLDGGYYVLGGMKKLGDVLKTKFINSGGVLSLKDRVIKINVSRGRVVGVDSERRGTILAKYVISTVGLKQTFSKLMNEALLPTQFTQKIRSLKPSVSAIILYLGLRGRVIPSFNWGRTVWYTPNLNPDAHHAMVLGGEMSQDIRDMIVAFPSKYDKSLAPDDCENLMCIITAPFQNDSYWQLSKFNLTSKIINNLSKLIPGIKERIEVCELATPSTISKFTLNDEGAIYGLASTNDQIDVDFMPSKTPIENLYLSSHWTTQGYGQAGVPVVALAAKHVASVIRRKDLASVKKRS